MIIMLTLLQTAWVKDLNCAPHARYSLLFFFCLNAFFCASSFKLLTGHRLYFNVVFYHTLKSDHIALHEGRPSHPLHHEGRRGHPAPGPTGPARASTPRAGGFVTGQHPSNLLAPHSQPPLKVFVSTWPPFRSRFLWSQGTPGGGDWCLWGSESIYCYY